MSYCIKLVDASFKIPETPEVVKALHSLNTNPKYKHLKSGGQHLGDPTKERRWFVWMPEKYQEDERFQTVESIFRYLGFGYNIIEEGKNKYIDLISYDKKSGDEDYFLAVTAPFVEEGSYLFFTGEDGNSWRYDVIDGKLQEATGTVKFYVTHTENVLKD